MLHAVKSNQGSSSAQTCLAVNGNCAGLSLGSGQELWDNLVGRGCAIKEVQVQVLDALLSKLVLFVLWLIQPDD